MFKLFGLFGQKPKPWKAPVLVYVDQYWIAGVLIDVYYDSRNKEIVVYEGCQILYTHSTANVKKMQHWSIRILVSERIPDIVHSDNFKNSVRIELFVKRCMQRKLRQPSKKFEKVIIIQPRFLDLPSVLMLAMTPRISFELYDGMKRDIKERMMAELKPPQN